MKFDTPALHYIYLYGHQRVVRGGQGRLQLPYRNSAGDPWSYDFIGPPSPAHLQQIAVREGLSQMRAERHDYPHD